MAPNFPLCNKCPETQEHLFMSCEVAQRMWDASGLGIISNNTHCISVGEWVKNFMSLLIKEGKQEEARVVEFVGILWSIWLARNQFVFGNGNLVPADIMGKV